MAQFLEWLEAVRDGGALREIDLRQLAMGSTFRLHPLGFIQSDLLRLGDGQRLRAHLWSQEWTHGQGDRMSIHDHICEIRSVVIHGAVEHSYYSVESTSDPTHDVLEVHYDGQTTTLSPSDEVRCSLVGSFEQVSAGHRWSFPPGSFHATRVVTPTAASLVWVSVPTRTHPRVVAPIGSERGVQFDRQVVTETQKRRWVESVMQAR